MDEKTNLKRCLQYIEENLNKDLTVTALAGMMGYTKHYFCDWFRYHMGMPISEYLRMLRLEEAVQAMVHGKQITSVADSSGYDTLAGFNKAFKREFNLSPSAYQKQNQKVLTPKFKEMGALRAVGYGISPYEGKEWSPFENALHWVGATLETVSMAEYAKLAKAQKGEIGFWYGPNEIDGNRTYFFGPIVNDFRYLPAGMVKMELPPALYAIFTTVPVNIDRDKICFRQTLENVKEYIYTRWFDENAKYEIDQEKTVFEFYRPSRGAKTPDSPVDIYVPVLEKAEKAE